MNKKEDVKDINRRLDRLEEGLCAIISRRIDKDGDDVGKTYDYYVKNWGTENTKETETGREVVKEYEKDDDGKEDKEDFEI